MNFVAAEHAATLVLFAAVMHALWNAILKIRADRAQVILLITGGAAFGSAIVATVLPWPAPAAFPFILLSTIIHCAYLGSLSIAYQRVDLSVAYPIARGGAPAVVLILSLLFLKDVLRIEQAVGIVVLVLGIFCLAFGPLKQSTNRNGLGYAALTACFIAGYSIVDGMGARAAGNAHSYAAWLFICQFVPVLAFVLWRQFSGQSQISAVLKHWRMGLLGGLLSLASYWIVIWAMTVISVPVAVALRETSVVFAMVLGVIWLKEPWSAGRWLAVVLVLIGVLLIRL